MAPAATVPLRALTQAGVGREEAYEIVQRNAMKVLAGEGDFQALLAADPEVTLAPGDLAASFDPAYHTKHVDAVFERVLAGD